jgi:hypothetical protein
MAHLLGIHLLLCQAHQFPRSSMRSFSRHKLNRRLFPDAVPSLLSSLPNSSFSEKISVLSKLAPLPLKQLLFVNACVNDW